MADVFLEERTWRTREVSGPWDRLRREKDEWSGHTQTHSAMKTGEIWLAQRRREMELEHEAGLAPRWEGRVLLAATSVILWTERVGFGSPEKTGRELKAEGQARAVAATPSSWVERVDLAIAGLARSGFAFTAEDVRSVAGDPPNPNAMGGRFTAAARKGLIVQVGFAEAERPERHANRMLEWRGVP
jgi:hypothetical protein